MSSDKEDLLLVSANFTTLHSLLKKRKSTTISALVDEIVI